jgi:hypothetical protein
MSGETWQLCYKNLDGPGGSWSRIHLATSRVSLREKRADIIHDAPAVSLTVAVSRNTCSRAERFIARDVSSRYSQCPRARISGARA